MQLELVCSTASDKANMFFGTMLKQKKGLPLVLKILYDLYYIQMVLPALQVSFIIPYTKKTVTSHFSESI